MNKQFLSIFTALALSLGVGCGSDEEESTEPEPTPETEAAPTETPEPAEEAPAIPRLTTAMPSPISSGRPPANTGPDPEADYDRLDRVHADHDSAVGKTVLIRGYIVNPASPGEHVTINDCVNEYEELMYAQGTYSAEMIPLVRAVPSHRPGPNEQCPRIHMRITGFHSSFDKPQGEILAIYDVQPDPQPESLPDGVDYVSMADALFAGATTVGKVVDFAVYAAPRPSEENGQQWWTLYSTGCHARSGWNAFLYVQENDDNRDILQSIPHGQLDPRGCQRVRARVTEGPQFAFPARLRAELIGIGDPVELPSPRHNP